MKIVLRNGRVWQGTWPWVAFAGVALACGSFGWAIIGLIVYVIDRRTTC
jgi:hypothetical protein